MIGGFPKQKCFVRAYGDSKHNQRCAFLLGLLENSALPAVRLSDPDPDLLIATIGDLDDLLKCGLPAPAC